MANSQELTPQSVTPGSPLLRLPTEPHLEILTHLEVDPKDKPSDDDFSLLHLRLVNRYFHHLVRPCPRLRYTNPTREDSVLLACKDCLRFCPLKVMGSYISIRERVPRPCRPRRVRFCGECHSAQVEKGYGYSSETDSWAQKRSVW